MTKKKYFAGIGFKGVQILGLQLIKDPVNWLNWNATLAFFWDNKPVLGLHADKVATSSLKFGADLFGSSLFDGGIKQEDITV